MGSPQPGGQKGRIDAGQCRTRAQSCREEADRRRSGQGEYQQFHARMTRVETDVATALTRASRRLQKRQPPRRFPSPWTEAVDFLCFPQSRATPMFNFFARSGAKIEKIDSL